MRRLFRWFVYALLLILAFYFLGDAAEQSKGIADRVSHSTYSTDVGGTAALYRLVESYGYAAVRSSSAATELRGEPMTLVVLTEDPAPRLQPNPPVDVAGLQELARNGWSVLLFGVGNLPADAIQKLDLTAGPASTAVAPQHPSMAGLPMFAEPGAARMELRGAEWVPLVGLGPKAYAGKRRFGKGSLIVIASSHDFSNERLASPGHAELAVRLISLATPNRGAVLFDEFTHGFRGDDTVWARIGLGGQLAVAQFLLLFAVVVYSVGARFGYALPPTRLRPPLGEYVEAIARLYERGMASGLALQTIRKAAIRRLARSLRGPLGTQTVPDGLPPSLEQALIACENASQETPRTEEAVRLVAALDREVAAFEDARRGSGRAG